MRRVRTEWGDIECEVVVNAGGMYAAEIGRLAGVRVPIIPFAHEYLVSQPFPAMQEARAAKGHLPTLRDPDLLVYYREEGGGLVMGGYERHSAPWSLDERLVDRIPPTFNGQLLEEDWDRFEEITENSKRRVPSMNDLTVTKLINGPEAFTPDNEFCLGETEVRGMFVAAGFCAHGLAGAGGIGKVMAEWIHAGEPQLDLWHMDVRRFGPAYRSPSYTLKRVKEVYETYYDIRYPGHERQAGRPLRVSSAYGAHVAAGAAFGEKSGWERVNWYEPQREGRRRIPAPARMGGHALVARRSAPSTARRARRRRCSTSRASPSSTSRARGGGLPRAPVRQPRRARRRADHLHADAELARRHRVRLHRHAAGRGPLLDRHRDGVRPARRGLAAAARAARRQRRDPRHDGALGVLRALGPACARHPRSRSRRTRWRTRTSRT